MSSAAGCGRLLWWWMWCAASDCGRHLAVNNGVRRQISDSGAIRSVAVPNVKITRGFVAFWHNARPVCGELTLRWNAAAASRPPWPRPCRRSCRCAIAHRSSGRRTAVDRFRCDPRKELPLAGRAADPHSRRIAPAVFHALPYNQSPLPRPANTGLRFAAKSIHH